ncbi:MAG: ComEA family DNA-binding protein [Woeseiaceae bacterium]
MKTQRMFGIGAALGLLVPVFAFAGPVNVNTADAETIAAELQGIGMSKAIAIVEYRKTNGPFKSADDLLAIKGIGERTIELNRDNILVQGGNDPKKK